MSKTIDEQVQNIEKHYTDLGEKYAEVIRAIATYIAHFHSERVKALVEEILNLRAEIAVRNEADDRRR